MAENIERKALKEYLSGGKFQEGCTGCDEPGEGRIECIVDEIDNFPAADVAPVRRGRWLDVDCFDIGFWQCSYCGFLSEAIAAPKLYKYCPNSGAKMEVPNDD